MNTEELVLYLKNQRTNASFVDRLKIVYRPYICSFSELINHVDEGDTVYDIGCGSGQFIKLITAFSRPRRVKGIDIDLKLIENARALHEHSNIETVFDVYDGV
ncbi:methyltransferase domain-containing protein [Tunicatimonas sp.]|uniref:methyltransferase domain-containing protein n=1 Tax=Tunicatimonas sp. TaxID=1940096 RepID=UPI003C7957D0